MYIVPDVFDVFLAFLSLPDPSVLTTFFLGMAPVARILASWSVMECFLARLLGCRFTSSSSSSLVNVLDDSTEGDRDLELAVMTWDNTTYSTFAFLFFCVCS
jgi:hypothetical protein